ncbi:UTP--glucose-1-phosphate uridylyltransferase-domain-containing protein, partial [Crucibulum laeve]
AGATIKHSKNAHGINVPRKHFSVKSYSDIFLIKSDIYSLQHGQPVINENRMFKTAPVIKLSDHFKKRFKIPKILKLDHLMATGEECFGRNVTLRGTDIDTLPANLLVANEGQRIGIPDGCILENRLLSDN